MTTSMRYFDHHRPRRVAVFRVLQLGDLLCTIPTLRALRATVPHARIALIGLPSMRGFAARYPHYVDDFIDFPGMTGMPEQPARDDALPAFIDEMRARRFDLAIQLHGDGGPTNALVRSFGATTNAGFCRMSDAARFDANRYLPWDPHAPEPSTGLALLRRLGADPVAVADSALELPILAAEQAEWLALAESHRLRPSTFVCIHPGARWSSRRWPLERFAAVAARLAEAGSRIVVTGSADERMLVRALVQSLAQRGVQAVDLAGRTSLGALAALLRDAALLISNDTGISHVAAAVRAPSVVVASGSDVARWAPLDTGRHRILAHDAPCRPCMYRDCPIDHRCSTGTSVDAVVDAASAHLGIAATAVDHAA